MEKLLVIGIALLVFMLWVMYDMARRAIWRHGIAALAFRWLTGHPHHGHAATDAGWIRPGRVALTRTRHATRFQHKPRLHRALIRTGGTAWVLTTAYIYFIDHWDFRKWMIISGLLTAAYLVLEIHRDLGLHGHNRTWVKPLHNRLAPIVGVPVANSPHSWLKVETDRSKAEITMPHGWNGTQKDRERISQVVGESLGMDNPDVRWNLHGPSSKAIVLNSPPPPDKIKLAELLPHIEKAQKDEIVLGMGRDNKPVKTDLAGELPHIGLSIPTGGGKSMVARLTAAQVLHNGGIVMILDVKRISHAWARDLPNVSYAKSTAEIHEALIWLGAEIDRRNRVADAGTDVEGEVHANVGPRLFVIAEEMNVGLTRLRRYWTDELNGKGKSPAIAAFEEAMFMGRQVRVNVLAVAQMMTARASGSTEARENMGTRVLGGFHRNTWQMLCPEFPMPNRSGIKGRYQVATHEVKECQGGLLSGVEARQFAISGEVALPQRGMPGIYAGAHVANVRINPDTPALTMGNNSNSYGFVINTPDGLVTIGEACAYGIVERSKGAMNQARWREKDTFPKPRGMRNRAHVYAVDDIIEWDRGIVPEAKEAANA